MTQQEYENKIKELEKQNKELEKQIEELKMAKQQPNRWKPTHNEGYLLIRNDGNIGLSYWNNDDMDRWRYLTGNCFNNKKEAEEYKKQIEYTAKYKNYIEKHSKPIDWDSYEQKKFAAYYDFDDKVIGVEQMSRFKDQGAIYASSEEIIWDVINCIEEDNFIKYVLMIK